MPMNEKKVFISYSHDSDEHREQVLALSERLRQDGIETLLDQYVNGSPPQGWPRWMLDQLDAANFVLVVCTETYYRRFRGHEESGKGKGVDWEGALITQEIYKSRSRTLKFVPVFLSAAVEDWIPEPMCSLTHYALTSETNYQRLYDFLLEQAGVEPQPLGTLKAKPRRQGTALTFAEPPSSVAAKVDISRIIKYAPADLIGREAETQILNDAWKKVRNYAPNRPHLLTFVALGGEGKTSLVAKWAAELAGKDWPGCEAVFAWSFYSQGTREQAAASSDVFLKEALIFFGDPEMAESAAGAFDKGRRLARLVGERRALLILDGLEPLQYAPNAPTPGELKDQGLAALLKGLAAASLGLGVVTTRYSIPDLRAFIGNTVYEEKLTRLSTEAGVALLLSFGIKGSHRKNIPGADGRILWNEFEKLVEDVKGHALTLNLLGTYLCEAHAGDIRRRNLVKIDDTGKQGEHAFHVMDAYVRWMAPSGFRVWLRCLFSKKEREMRECGRRALALLQLLGLFDRPATADTLKALWQGKAITGLTEPLLGLSEVQRDLSLRHLETAKLLTVNRDPAGSLLFLDAHPLLREYFAKQLREQKPKAWRAAHQRLYAHLCASTREGEQPSLEDLQPLYQAVAHGCQAGLQQEACVKVYRDRILHGTGNDGFYSTKKLGAHGSDLGAVACFFETPWSRVAPAFMAVYQAWLLNEAATRLCALGRLTEALEPMRAGIEGAVRLKDWNNAARYANNLSELELTLGEVAGAMGDAEHSETYADRSGDAYLKSVTRTTHAYALHQAGRRAEAEAHFREAEEMQAENQPAYPLMYSVWGFRYCNLLLTEAERGAAKVEGIMKKEELLAACHAVEQRGKKMFEWRVLGDSLLDIALDHLTLGCAALYAFSLDPSTSKNQKSASKNIQAAVAGLHRAGQNGYLPLGLLSRAGLRTLTGPRTGPESAQTDLDEAWEIAERGPMPLFLADIHLYRARLFGRQNGEGGRQNEETPYPWESPEKDLDEARRLIEKHGYWRRKEELEDAEADILGTRKLEKGRVSAE